MSNEHYDEFCKADLPELSLLDRTLLGHYCQRFSEKVSPPRAWPPLTELLRITGAHEKSISRSLGRLSKRSFLIRVTRASKVRGLKAEYAINRLLIKSYIKVTEELPKDKQVTEQTQEGNLSALKVEPYGYSKRIKPINVRTDDDRFYEVILKGVPKERRHEVTAGANYVALLNELEALDTSPQAIHDYLNETSWNVAKSVGAVVEIRLKELVAQRIRVLALKAQEADTELLWRLEEDKRRTEAVTYDQALNYANKAREAMNRNKA